MSRLTVEEQLDRAGTFLIALTDPDTRAPLEPYGLTEEEVTRGWRLLQAALDQRDSASWRPAEPALLDHLRQIGDRWFPIAAGPLAERHPEIARFLLRRSDGKNPLRPLCAFVHRLDVLVRESEPFGSDGPQARESVADPVVHDPDHRHELGLRSTPPLPGRLLH